MMLVVPSDPMRHRRPDPHFADEAAAARELGLDVALVDHDALQGSSDLAAARRSVGHVNSSADAVYRGWMVTGAQYALLEASLLERNVRLRTTAAQYRAGHELPGWYDALTAFTPQTHWTTGNDLDDFAKCLRLVGPGAAMLRDYTKSMKHYWDEAALIPDVNDLQHGRRIAERFLALRGDAFDGGLVVRQLEDFVGAEVRSWWIGGRCTLLSAHPDTPDDQPDVPADLLGRLAPAMRSLALSFVTADLVRCRDGQWHLVEVGDGQVSDRPASCPAKDLVAALTR
ncbi:MAG: ATP-grasp domain-containing protein [Janthinobacterium lividum]